ncbi:DET1 homolog [Neocloeon triangulifer]|uniref:DET1 homolog n=1 Tax=Neocloeon triangulifer TaxID=2078957 RepID=UPI00286F89AA|nr:DET1 homolog [Neocloeon triangulifer]
MESGDGEEPMILDDEDVVHEPIPVRKIPSQNVVLRLLHREVHGRSIQSRRCPQNQTREFYQSVFPNLTLINVDTPPVFLRKFNPNGSHLLAFSSDQTSIEIYKYLGPSAGGTSLQSYDGDCVDFAEFNRNQNRVNIFELYFKRKWMVNLAQSGEQLNRECSLFTDDSKYVIVSSSMFVDGNNGDQSNFFDIYSNNEAVTPNSSFRLEDYTIYLVDIYNGRLCDTINLKTDKICLSHNQGIYLLNDTLAVLSIQHQTIHIFKLVDGKFQQMQKIGRFCFPGDEEQLADVLPVSVPSYREATINALKHRLLTFLYFRAINVSRQTGTPYELRMFYQYFDHIRTLKLWKMQLLDEDHLLLKYAVENVVTLKTPEPNSATSFFVVYNIPEATVLAVFENSAEEMLTLLENFCDYFRNTKLHKQFACSPSNNIHARHLMQRLKQTIVSARFGGPTEAIKRLLCQLPISAQSFTSSPYLDFSLFSYDEKRVSMIERPKCCGEYAIRFYGRNSGLLKFRMHAGIMNSNMGAPRVSRRLVAYIFHPTDPFAISVQRANNAEYIVSLHVRHSSQV